MIAPMLRHSAPPPASLPEEPMVSALSLSPSDKQRLWAYLKEHQPERAAFFSDPVVQALMRQGAVPAFRLADCEAAGLSIPPHCIDR
jgi:hypothetical protein